MGLKRSDWRHEGQLFWTIVFVTLFIAWPVSIVLVIIRFLINLLNPRR